MLNLGVSVGGKNFDGSKYNWKKDVGGRETLRDFFNELKETLIEVDREVIAEEVALGFDKKARVRVDGVWDRSIRDVQPVGTIQHFARLDQALFMLQLYRKLVEYSKIRTGMYSESHFVYLNGRFVAGNYNQLFIFLNSSYQRDSKDSDVFHFVNVTVYSRRLEHLGVTSGGSSGRVKTKVRRRKKRGSETRTIGLPNGAYWRTYQSMKRQGGKVAGRGFYFDWIANSNFGISIHAARTNKYGHTTFQKNGKFKSGKGRPYIHACIIFKPYAEALQ